MSKNNILFMLLFSILFVSNADAMFDFFKAKFNNSNTLRSLALANRKRVLTVQPLKLVNKASDPKYVELKKEDTLESNTNKISSNDSFVPSKSKVDYCLSKKEFEKAMEYPSEDKLSQGYTNKINKMATVRDNSFLFDKANHNNMASQLMKFKPSKKIKIDAKNLQMALAVSGLLGNSNKASVLLDLMKYNFVPNSVQYNKLKDNLLKLYKFVTPTQKTENNKNILMLTDSEDFGPRVEELSSDSSSSDDQFSSCKSSESSSESSGKMLSFSSSESDSEESDSSRSRSNSLSEDNGIGVGLNLSSSSLSSSSSNSENSDEESVSMPTSWFTDDSISREANSSSSSSSSSDLSSEETKSSPFNWGELLGGFDKAIKKAEDSNAKIQSECLSSSKKLSDQSFSFKLKEKNNSSSSNFDWEKTANDFTESSTRAVDNVKKHIENATKDSSVSLKTLSESFNPTDSNKNSEEKSNFINLDDFDKSRKKAEDNSAQCLANSANLDDLNFDFKPKEINNNSSNIDWSAVSNDFDKSRKKVESDVQENLKNAVKGIKSIFKKPAESYSEKPANLTQIRRVRSNSSPLKTAQKQVNRPRSKSETDIKLEENGYDYSISGELSCSRSRSNSSSGDNGVGVGLSLSSSNSNSSSSSSESYSEKPASVPQIRRKRSNSSPLLRGHLKAAQKQVNRSRSKSETDIKLEEDDLNWFENGYDYSLSEEDKKTDFQKRMLNLYRKNKYLLKKNIRENKKEILIAGGLGTVVIVAGLYAFNKKFRDGCNYYCSKAKDKANNYLVSPIMSLFAKKENEIQREEFLDQLDQEIQGKTDNLEVIEDNKIISSSISKIEKLSDFVDCLNYEQWKIENIHSLLSEAYKNPLILDINKISEINKDLESTLEELKLSLTDIQKDFLLQVLN